jgi:hypothetical protein
MPRAVFARTMPRFDSSVRKNGHGLCKCGGSASYLRGAAASASRSIERTVSA